MYGTYKTETYFASVVYPFTPDVILLSAPLVELSVYMFIGITGVIGLSQTKLPKEANLKI